MKALIVPTLFALGLSACVEAEPVVRNADGAERIAAYEDAVEETTTEREAQPRVVLPSGPDYTREGENASTLGRYEVPTDTPMYRIPKVEQTGATVCPDGYVMGADTPQMASVPTSIADFDAWLLEDERRGAVGDADGTEYTVLMNGIERGYIPQKFDEVRVRIDGEEETLRPSGAGNLGGVIMAMTPCQVVAVNASMLDDDARDALDIEDGAGMVRLQLVEAKLTP